MIVAEAVMANTVQPLVMHTTCESLCISLHRLSIITSSLLSHARRVAGKAGCIAGGVSEHEGTRPSAITHSSRKFNVRNRL